MKQYKKVVKPNAKPFTKEEARLLAKSFNGFVEEKEAKRKQAD